MSPMRIVAKLWVVLGAVSLTLGICLSVPSLATATTVANGNFETGTLEGWNTFSNKVGTGKWYAYSGTTTPIGTPPPPPPDGTYGAVSAQGAPGTHVLYQDLYVSPGANETLSMVVYYESHAILAAPPSLSYEVEPNQQYRIDLIKPSAPLESLESSDIFATLFHTVTEGPETQGYKTVSIDLAPFAGQTVRLRLAEVDNLSNFSAGVDDVKVVSTAPPVPPSNSFSFGKVELNKKKGTAMLEVNVPGAGTLTAADVKQKGKRVKRTTVATASAGTATLILKPTGAGIKALTQKGKLPFKLAVTFTPTGGAAATQRFSGKLKLALKPQAPKS
jgi:hypothetical protein